MMQESQPVNKNVWEISEPHLFAFETTPSSLRFLEVAELSAPVSNAT